MRAFLLGAILLAAMLPPATALPTPGFFCEASDAAVGRVFPEPEQTNDFVSYDEARCGLDILLAEAPDRIKLDVVGQSVGWGALTGGHDTFDVYVVRVSNYASDVPDAEKIRLVFQLSIHGNEKGGREGGLRMIEDLVRGIGHAAKYPELVERLDIMEILFVFPNPDGWTHEENEYRHNTACYASEMCALGLAKPGDTGVERANYVRYNGNGVDVNREWPTAGWVRERHTPMSEPEAIALVEYLKKETNVRYASDLHGMLAPSDGKQPGSGCVDGAFFTLEPDDLDATCYENAHEGAPGHFVLTMLPAGRQTPLEMELTTRLAELVKERLNNDPAFFDWQTVPPGEQGWWGGEFNDWGTVWDTLGYTDSGFTSDFYAQDHGLNAPGVDFEFSYNHVYFDNYYPGVAQRMNAIHVHATREIVRAFMDRAALDVRFAIDAQGRDAAYVPSAVVAEAPAAREGWVRENPADDAFERMAPASINAYFEEIGAFVTNGRLAPVASPTARALEGFESLIVPGSAYRSLDEAGIAAARAFAEAGGTLVLTDEALQMLPALGLARDGSVARNLTYAGHANVVDAEHALVADLRGLARQTYEPVPLGFNLSAQDAPVWYVPRDALASGVDVLAVAGKGQGAEPEDAWATLGEARLGSGRVVFLGALLPDPVAGPDAFYGADAYATTYTGDQILRNALGWRAGVEESPVPLDDPTTEVASAPESAATPGLPALALVVALALLALLRRRG